MRKKIIYSRFRLKRKRYIKVEMGQIIYSIVSGVTNGFMIIQERLLSVDCRSSWIISIRFFRITRFCFASRRYLRNYMIKYKHYDTRIYENRQKWCIIHRISQITFMKLIVSYYNKISVFLTHLDNIPILNVPTNLRFYFNNMYAKLKSFLFYHTHIFIPCAPDQVANVQ